MPTIKHPIRNLHTLIPEAEAKEYRARIMPSGTIVLRPKKEEKVFNLNKYELDEDGYPIIKLNLSKFKIYDTIDKDGFTLLPPELRGED